MAEEFVERGSVAFSCTPDLFPELMAATMNGRDLTAWASQHDLDYIPDD